MGVFAASAVRGSVVIILDVGEDASGAGGLVFS